MSLVSIEFFIFLAITGIIYFVVPKKMQWKILLIANYIFYILAGITYVPFLLFTTFTIYLGTIKLAELNQDYKKKLEEIKKNNDREQKKNLKAASIRNKRRVVALICVLNIGVLVVLKYSGFLVENINVALSTISVPTLKVSTDWVLPLGISFYTFQAVGYLMDVYRDRVEAERNFFKVSLFLSFFPQMVQGPISRFEQLGHQLTEAHSFEYDQFKKGSCLILWGLFKKLIIAERVALISNWIFNIDNQVTGILILLGAVAYSIRVYADFSGGIDIARGAAKILGIELVQNFEQPYFAATISEFWRRWHMTLGSWFRDYVFYPLSLSKRFTKAGKWGRKYLGNYIGKLIPVLTSQFVVFTLIGIWHGSSWKYIVFGFYHGIMIVGGILLGPKMHKFGEKIGMNMNSFGFRIFQILRTCLIVAFGRILTMGEDMKESLFFLTRLFQKSSRGSIVNTIFMEIGIGKKEFVLLIVVLFLLFVISYKKEKGIQIRESLLQKHLFIQWSAYLILIFAILIFGVYGYGYSGSDFIYRGF